MNEPFRMTEVFLKGTPRQRGRGHGEALRTRIRAIWLREDVEADAAARREEYLRRLVDESGFVAAARRWTPDLVEEVEGLAEGANVTFREAFAMQLLDEPDWYLGSQAAGQDHCSALGAYGQAGAVLVAQNADMGVAADGYLTLLHMEDTRSDWRAHVITIPGTIGVYGLNNHGVGVCLNAMGAFMNHSPAGLGTIFVSRGILAHTSVDEAIAFARRVRHATGENYTVGGPDRVVALECSANQVAQFVPWPGARRVYHTNHPIVNTDLLLTPEVVAGFPPERQERYRLAMANTRSRLAALEERLKDTSRPVTVAAIRDALSSHDDEQNPVCRHRSEGRPDMTNACMIMELSEDPVLHLTSGPPCYSEFRTFRFQK